METVVQVLGITFVCIIMLCIGWVVVEYVANRFGDNNKLKENLRNFGNKR